MRRQFLTALASLAVASTLPGQAAKDTARDLAAVKANVDSLRADLDVVKTQLAQLLRLMSQSAAPRQTGAAPALPSGPVRASVEGEVFLGRADAPVTVVEFSDYQCPFCSRFFATTLPALKTEYIDAGKVRYVFRDYPIDQLHPNARKAAEAAHCAGDQGKFWEMHDLLFRNAKALALSRLGEYARSLGLDGASFDECLGSGRHALRVDRGLADGAAAGVRGTPGFVIGRTTATNVVEGTPVRGAQPIETFRRIIDQLLAQPQTGGTP